MVAGLLKIIRESTDRQNYDAYRFKSVLMTIVSRGKGRNLQAIEENNRGITGIIGIIGIIEGECYFGDFFFFY
jgi:hypothetical protein